jgi:hypothetical protein
MGLSKADVVAAISSCRRELRVLQSLSQCPIMMNCALALYNPSFANQGSHERFLKSKSK